MKRYEPIQFSSGIRESKKGHFVRVDDVIDGLQEMLYNTYHFTTPDAFIDNVNYFIEGITDAK